MLVQIVTLAIIYSIKRFIIKNQRSFITVFEDNRDGNNGGFYS
jgi:hypothetical protein